MRLEHKLLEQLIYNEEYTRKTLPFLKKEYFHDKTEAVLFEEITDFFQKFNKLPNKDVLLINTGNRNDISEDEYKQIQNSIDRFSDVRENLDWLTEQSEQFCKDKAVFNAIMECVSIIDGKNKQYAPSAMPSLLTQALSVSFKNDIGHDYFDDAEQRWEYYHQKDDNRIPFDLEIFNKITRGGLKKKTLNCIMAPTGVGKTIFMCHLAASSLMQGYNVLYITMEMAEEEISERIDANLMDIFVSDIENISKPKYLEKIEGLQKKSRGRLKVKEFPTGVHAGHFRALIEELRLKNDFTPDLLIIDYLGICGSQRVKQSGGVNTNTFFKNVSEELRDLGKEYLIPVFTGMQVNRGGQENSDVDITNTADAIATTNTFDLFFVMMAPEELVERNQYLVKQLKNRYNDVNYYKRFVIGIEKAKMKFFDVEEIAHEGISDRGKIDERNEELALYDRSTTNGDDFSNFKF
jgi:archaellum biogenesis ATPase FlaH